MEPNGEARTLTQKELILTALERVVQRENSLTLMKGGVGLFARDKKLFAKYAFGVVISLVLTVILSAAFYFLFQLFAIDTLKAMIQGDINWPNWLSWLSTPEQWIRDFGEFFIKMVSYLIIVYVSVRLAFLFMIYWTDEMVASVMKISRNRPDIPLSASRIARLVKVGFRLSLRTLGVSLLFFFLSWIPFIGYPLFMLGAAWSSGKDVISTVIMVYAEEEISIPDGYKISFKGSVSLGWLFCAVYSVPLFGILFLPVLYILQVCAFTFAIEREMRTMLGVDDKGQQAIES